MKNIKPTILAIALLNVFSSSVMANETQKECDNQGVSCEQNEYFNIGYVSADFGSSYKGNGFSVGYGYRFANDWGVTGDLMMVRTDGKQIIDTNQVDRDFSGFGLNIGPEYYITNNFSIFGTLGFIYFTDTQRSNNQNWIDTGNDDVFGNDIYDWEEKTTKDKGPLSLTYGLGARYKLSRSLSVHASYKLFSNDLHVLSNKYSNNAKALTVGVGFHF